MYDFHLHSAVSFDGNDTSREMAEKASAMGLREICFTDHLDYDPTPDARDIAFSTDVYNAAYDGLHVPGITIRRGAEFGMLPDNQAVFRSDMKRRHFDFVIGSVHYVDNQDIYYDAYWQGKTSQEAERRYFETVLQCVRAHDGFDVLGHLTYVGKLAANPNPRPIPYEDYGDILDEILKTLVDKGIGLEVNTSGFDRCGGFLPTVEYVRRFRALGGSVVTVGSDAHNIAHVGQYCREACQMVSDVFGYVCTFADRKPIFHKV